MSSNNTGDTQSTFLVSNTVTILCSLGVAVFIYPAASQLVMGEPVGDGISELLVGGLAMILILGLKAIDWVEDIVPLSDSQDRFAILALLGIIIGGSLLVLTYFPDSPGAIGLLLPSVPAALLVIRDVLS